tara:strand:- start:2079 stop:2354 length:276 start_codon:yes stop_codon:yes gene_type:complete
MKQEKINYRDIIDLGFKEEEVSDNVYFREHGFAYSIITKNITKRIYLDWEKETKLCKIVRIDSPKTCNIMAEIPIMNIKQIKNIISFFNKN